MNVVNKVANAYNEDAEIVKMEMEYAISQAFLNPDPEIQKKLKLYFPDGKPTLEEFIATISNIVKSQGAC